MRSDHKPGPVCPGCGYRLSPGTLEAIPIEYEHCRTYCCGCCPSKNGYKGESCQREYLDRKAGRPVGVVESLAAFDNDRQILDDIAIDAADKAKLSDSLDDLNKEEGPD